MNVIKVRQTFPITMNATETETHKSTSESPKIPIRQETSFSLSPHQPIYIRTQLDVGVVAVESSLETQSLLMAHSMTSRRGNRSSKQGEVVVEVATVAANAVSSDDDGDNDSGVESTMTPMFQISDPTTSDTINLDDILNDIFDLDGSSGESPMTDAVDDESRAQAIVDAAVEAFPVPSCDLVLSAPVETAPPPSVPSTTPQTVPLTKEQIVEKRKRNREHATRSRMRKKFLLESQQAHIRELQEQIAQFKTLIRKEAPQKAEGWIQTVCGDIKFTPVPMPSGFGPVKTLMEPDSRLVSVLSEAQQNFCISDPTLDGNPIVYCSRGFLDLTGYTKQEILGRNMNVLHGPSTDQGSIAKIRQAMTNGVDTSICLLNYRADGSAFWDQLFVAALRDADDNVVNFVSSHCEVSKAVVKRRTSTSGSSSGD